MKLKIYLAFIATALLAVITLPSPAATKEVDLTTADELFPLLPEDSLQKLNATLNAQGHLSLEKGNLTASALKALWKDWTDNSTTDRLHHCYDIDNFYSLTFSLLNNQKTHTPAAKTIQAYLLHRRLCHGLQTPSPEKKSTSEKHYKQLMNIESTLESIVRQPPYVFYTVMILFITAILTMCAAETYDTPSHH